MTHTDGIQKISATKFHRWWLVASIMYLGLVIYGSLVPLQYEPMEWSAAVAQFQEVPFLDLDISNRADWVANILLFMPLAFLCCGLLIGKEHGQARAVLTTLALIIVLSLLAMSIEFTQQWFPPRTVSQNDIVAETLGGLFGCVCWFLFGQQVHSWLQEKRSTTNPAYYLERTLLVYTVVLFVYSIMPLDIVVSLEELQLKTAQGKIDFHPDFSIPATIEEWSSTLRHILIFVPVGFLLCLKLMKKVKSDNILSCAIWLILIALVLEVSQIFVYSRFATTNAFLLKVLGGMLGILWANSWVTNRYRRSGRTQHTTTQRSVASCVGCFVLVGIYASFLCVVFWWPFDQISSELEVRLLWQRYWQIPFTNYYWGTEFNALTNVLQKLLLLMPLGYLLQMAIARCPIPQHLSLALTTCGVITLSVFAVIIERGQAIFGGRYPDVTDTLLYIVGIFLGLGLHAFLNHQSQSQDEQNQFRSQKSSNTHSDVIRLD